MCHSFFSKLNVFLQNILRIKCLKTLRIKVCYCFLKHVWYTSVEYINSVHFSAHCFTWEQYANARGTTSNRRPQDSTTICTQLSARKYFEHVNYLLTILTGWQTKKVMTPNTCLLLFTSYCWYNIWTILQYKRTRTDVKNCEVNITGERNS
jgi:hypothetical protein